MERYTSTLKICPQPLIRRTDFGVAMMDVTRGIAGHEGAGTVVAVGEGSDSRWKVGDRAGIKWIASVCGECEFCLNGADEVHCVAQKNSGFSAPGTFQEYVLAPSNYASKIPDGVLDEEAGPIMCGGVSARRAVLRMMANADDDTGDCLHSVQTL